MRNVLYAVGIAALASACADDGLPANAMVRDAGPQTGNCSYPADAVEPMAEGQVLWPYRWGNSIDLETDEMKAFDLGMAYCDPSSSQYKVFLFVSAPAT